MNVVRTTTRRAGAVGAALGLFVASLLPIATSNVAYAAPSGGQVTSRYIKLSSSRTGATNVSYEVNFVPAGSYTIRGIVVDICQGGDSPIVTDAACAAPTGFTWGTPTVTFGGGSTVTGGTWASGATAVNSGQTLKLSDATGTAVTTASNVNFTVSTVTNPSDTDTDTAGNQFGTFYARIITYNTDAGEFTTYAPGSEGNTDAIDYGGVALSLANSLDVTTKVQEALTFCMYTSAAGACNGVSGTNVTLGDSNGVLSDYTNPYTNSDAKFNVGSNAQSGVVVRLKGQNLCRTASPCADANTTNVINPSSTSGSMTCTADSTATGTEQFGLRVATAGTGITAASPFDCAANNHGFDTNTTNGVGSTFGATVASSTGPTDETASTTSLEFMAKAANTTEAGIYTTSLNFIATGTY